MGRLSKADREYIDRLCWMWNYFRTPSEDRNVFKHFLTWTDGWEQINSGSCKVVFIRPDRSYVIKFDYEPSGTLREEAAWTEWCRWRSARAELKKYLATIYVYYKGLIFQERVEPCDRRYDDCDAALRIAMKFRISHDWHHSHNPLKFFDYDSYRYPLG